MSFGGLGASKKNRWSPDRTEVPCNDVAPVKEKGREVVEELLLVLWPDYGSHHFCSG